MSASKSPTPNLQTQKFVNSPTQKSSIDNIMNTKIFTTFKLVDKQKEPTNEYSKCKKKIRYINQHKWKKKTLSQLFENQMKENRGILTGKMNDIIVVDLDFYNKFKNGIDIPFDREGNLFLKDFGNDYIKRFNTLTFKTANGGEHLVFKYTPKIRTTTNDEHNIDIRSNGAYIVAPGSVIDKSIYNKSIKKAKDKVGYYTIENDTDIKDLPIELETWLSINLFKQTRTIKKPLKKNCKGEVTNKDAYEQDEVDLTEYSYTFTDDILIKILDGLPNNFFTDNVDWYCFTTAMKTINRKDLWEKYSQEKSPEKYNKEENEKMWDCARHKTYMCLEYLLENSSFVEDAKIFLSYFKLKVDKINEIKPDELLEPRQYLDINNDGGFFMNIWKKYIFARSDTGTGKTTAFKNYIKKTNKRFISIVSRVSLGKEQVKVFKEAGIDCVFHEEISEGEWWANEGNNIVVTIDSIIKMCNWEDFNDYVLYLDEYNSLIEYFVDCPNLCDKRVIVWNQLNKMLLQAEQTIMTDADISDNSINFIYGLYEDVKDDCVYIQNKYKHNKDKQATELFSYDVLLETISKQDKAMICLDSKNVGEKLCIDMKEKYNIDIQYYSSDTLEDIDLDAHKFVAFSPKVVYGLDSLMERPVFCYYKCHTISPVAMVQQVNRNRKITHLYYLFESKSWKSYRYDTVDDVKLEIK